jgi:predicted permease
MTDLRFGARMLRKSPGSTAAIVGLLALGIGAATVIFSVFDAVLLRPLPVRHPEELVRVVQRLPKTGPRDDFPFDYYQALRDHSTTLASVFAETPSSFRFPMTDPAPAEEISARAVTPEYFTALNVGALYGRVLTPYDEQDNSGDPPAVLSYGFWRRRFDGDPRAIGRTITLRGRKFVVVGILPRGFNGLSADTAPDVRIPNRAYAVLTGFPGANRAIELFGRLKPGVTRAQAEAECQSFFQSVVVPYYADIVKEFPNNGAAQLIKSGVNLDSVQRGESVLRDRFASPLQLLMVSVSVLLLIVCSNVGGLLLAQGVARSQEIAVRMAMGATRTRLIRQALVENSLLAVLGAAGGLWVGLLITPLAGRALPPLRDGTILLPLSLDVHMNGRVLLFCLMLSVITVVLFSAAPAITACRSGLDRVLRGSRSSAGLRGHKALIVVQIGLSTFLLAGASLLVRSFRELHAIDPGFDRDHIATFTLDFSFSKKDAGFIPLLMERVRQTPGVISAAISSVGVMRGRGMGATVAPVGEQATQADYLNASFLDVSPEYFDTMGIRLLAGRSLTSQDAPAGKPGLPAKVVVNQAFVRRFFPHADPLGQRFGIGLKAVESADYEIAGVMSDAKYRSLREPMIPTFCDLANDYSRVIYVRTRIRPELIFEPVRKVLAALDPSLAFIEMHTLAEEVDDSAAAERLTALLASVFGGIAVLLAGVGLYGLLAYAVMQRRREIGIRMALGAAALDIAGLTVRQTVGMAIVGLAAGLGAALACGPLVRSVLYGISPWDLTSLGSAVGFVLVVAAAATLVPALRAARVVPAVALREEA